MTHKFLLAPAVGLWLAALVAAGGWLLGYPAAPGRTAAASPSWPADSGLRPEPGRPTLVLFLHPHCPCSAASLDELAALMARAGDGLTTFAVFVVPPGAPLGWGESDLWGGANRLPGVRTVLDAGGREALRFGAATSGQALLYDGAGRRLFQGGITDGRGHRGDNPGRRAILAWLRGGAGRPDAPVFGCALQEDGE